MDTRTKHTIAQDRFTVIEKRTLDAERRKLNSNIQLITFEQKRVQKRFALLQRNFGSSFTDEPLKMRDYSMSEVALGSTSTRTEDWNETLTTHHSILSKSLNNSSQNLLSLPKLSSFRGRSSSYWESNSTANTLSNSDVESGEEEEEENEVRKSAQSNPMSVNSRRSTTKKTLPKLTTKSNELPLPVVAIIPPEEDTLFLIP